MTKNSEKNSNPQHEPNLIRLHPTSGGTSLIFETHSFERVSPDVFIALDHYSPSAHIITRKFNLTLSVNPDLWPVREFFDHFTNGALSHTQKCRFHGDKETGLLESNNLLDDLKAPLAIKGPAPFTFSVRVGTECFDYRYDSIGVAANERFGAVSQRKDTPFFNQTSHFEIKFCRLNPKSIQTEYLCINIHLQATTSQAVDRVAVHRHFKKGIRLFYHELGILPKQTMPFQTRLRDALCVMKNNAHAYQFSPSSVQSKNVMENNACLAQYSGENLPPQLALGAFFKAPLPQAKKPPLVNPKTSVNSERLSFSAVLQAGLNKPPAKTISEKPRQEDFPRLSP